LSSGFASKPAGNLDHLAHPIKLVRLLSLILLVQQEENVGGVDREVEGSNWKLAQELSGKQVWNKGQMSRRTNELSKWAVQHWPVYADWLSTTQGEDVAASLSLTLSAHHQYDAGLLLAYLLTSEATREELEGIVPDYQAWHSFVAEPLYLTNFSSGVGRIRWVLFYDKTEQGLIGFANAQVFAQELMVYHRLGLHEQVDSMLNQPNSDKLAALKQMFPSIKTAIFATESPSELVRDMIDGQLVVSVAHSEERDYVARLERMIKLAALDQ
jgi:hypothetical protein